MTTWDTTYEDQTFNSQLSLYSMNNVLVRNCVFENIASGNGIQVRNATNIRIENCTIRNITAGYGILLSSFAGTDGVVIEGCHIYNTGSSGIHAAQREDTSVFHLNTQILNNHIHDNGGASELHHCIYSHARDALIQGNLCHDTNGNCISQRVTATIRNNVCYNSKKACIRYYSDHDSGPFTTVLIENNILWNGDNAGDYSPLISLKDEPAADDSYLADIYIIRFNTMWSYSTLRYCIQVEDAAFDSKGVQVYGNLAINTANAVKLIDGSHVDVLTKNYTTTSTANLVNPTTPPYDLRLMPTHAARRFAIGAPAYPTTDIDGSKRRANFLDAGAHQPANFRQFFANVVLRQTSRSGGFQP